MTSSSTHQTGRTIMARAAASAVIHIAISDRSHLETFAPHHFASTLCGRPISREWSEVGGLVKLTPHGVDVGAIAHLDRWRAPGTELRGCARCAARWVDRLQEAHAAALAEQPEQPEEAPDVIADYGSFGSPVVRHVVAEFYSSDSDTARDARTLEPLSAYPTDDELAHYGYQCSALTVCGVTAYGIQYPADRGPGADCARCLAGVASDDVVMNVSPQGEWDAAPVMERRAPSSVGRPVDVDAVTSALLAAIDGATVDGRGRPYRGDGTVVALAEYGARVGRLDVSPEGVAAWVALRAPVVSAHASRWYGAWWDGDTLVLDVVETISRADGADAMAAARARGQVAVWDNGARECVPTDAPTLPMRSGSVVPFAEAAARRLLARSGAPMGRLAGPEWPIVSPSGQAAIAAAYRSLPEWDDAAVPAFRAFREETLRQLDALLAAGLSVIVQGTDPYVTPDGAPDTVAMMADIGRGTIRILSTRSTGGHPFLSDSDNDAFRAVHDVLGHAATGRGVDRHGEEAAYLSHARMYSPLARRALATETRGQNAAMIAAGGTFDVQRVALLPRLMSRPNYLEPDASELPAAAGQSLTFHLSAGLTLIY